jgi:transcriptional regulator with XRE-family HTH domain
MAWEKGIRQFGEVLYELIARKQLSVRAIAPRLGVSHSMLSHIHTGYRPPPLERLEKWADVFELEGKEREYFLDLAALACAPERVLRMFEPGHPAHDVIRMAVENQALRKLHAAETGEPYEPKKSPRKARRSPQ